MRRVLVVGLTGLFLLTATAMTGCDNTRGKADIPQKMIDLPKQGPVAAGAPSEEVGDQKKAESALGK